MRCYNKHVEQHNEAKLNEHGGKLMEWLVKIRKEKSLTQTQVATQCGISRQYYSFIEKGERGCLSDSTGSDSMKKVTYESSAYSKKTAAGSGRQQKIRRQIRKADLLRRSGKTDSGVMCRNRHYYNL